MADAPNQLDDLIDALTRKGAKVTKKGNGYHVIYDGKEAIIDTTEQEKKGKLTYRVKSGNTWIKVVFGVILLAKFLWLLKILTNSYINSAVVPEDKERRKAYYDNRAKSALPTLIDIFTGLR